MGQSAVIVTRAMILRVSAEEEPRLNQVELVSERMPYSTPYVN